ncbi:hypothetical protein B0H17DRAFT_1058869 [Mycena rosella]|uniref:Uncharacterized protein n=1 Tax=Mycena rosella TaxID=1033263 RepID=A0AAD7DKN8_MYCRO|nr:hypothetical protein B0H17DRAFT_1058869 [Mycena rosella]
MSLPLDFHLPRIFLDKFGLDHSQVPGLIGVSVGLPIVQFSTSLDCVHYFPGQRTLSIS